VHNSHNIIKAIKARSMKLAVHVTCVERELQMVQLSAARCSRIAIL
jgi:hypothetical protein